MFRAMTLSKHRIEITMVQLRWSWESRGVPYHVGGTGLVARMGGMCGPNGCKWGLRRRRDKRGHTLVCRRRREIGADRHYFSIPVLDSAPICDKFSIGNHNMRRMEMGLNKSPNHTKVDEGSAPIIINVRAHM